MAHDPTTFLAPLLALLSLYAGQKSYIAITNLQQYEERTEKAAKHLEKAASDLYKTRVTQATGAAAVCIPLYSPEGPSDSSIFVSSAVYMFACPFSRTFTLIVGTAACILRHIGRSFSQIFN